MPPCLCRRPSEHCSWVNNAFSNQLILLQAFAQANAWSNQSQLMEPGFCRLLAPSHKVKRSWLCVCIKSEHPAADMLETPLERTTSGQRSSCFSRLSCGTAETLMGCSLSLPAPQQSPMLTRYINAKSALKDPICSAGTSPRMLPQIKDLARTRGTAKVFSSGLLVVDVQNLPLVQANPTCKPASWPGKCQSVGANILLYVKLTIRLLQKLLLNVFPPLAPLLQRASCAFP